jgi:hypothetical protein
MIFQDYFRILSESKIKSNEIKFYIYTRHEWNQLKGLLEKEKRVDGTHYRCV